jgi:hypothetical protein
MQAFRGRMPLYHVPFDFQAMRRNGPERSPATNDPPHRQRNLQERFLPGGDGLVLRRWRR